MSKILFVATHSSVHAQGWISLARQALPNVEMVVYPLTWGTPDLTSYEGVDFCFPTKFMRRQSWQDPAPSNVRYAAGLPLLGPTTHRYLKTWLGAGGPFPLLHGKRFLARAISQEKPTLVHSMEFQRATYLTLQARKLVDPFPKWLATNWGSDIYYFRDFPLHRRLIKSVLESVDYYSCECERDVAIARELGLRGQPLKVMPNSGGVDLQNINSLGPRTAPSQRKRILVKAYEHFVGRGLLALDVLAACEDDLKDYEIIAYYTTPETRAKIESLRESTTLNFRTIVGHVPKQEILRHQLESRVYFAMSEADGISTSMLEAMACGSFPLQTETACCNEWFEDGVGGYSVSIPAFDDTVKKLKHALSDDSLVDGAAVLNYETIAKKGCREALLDQVRDFYGAALVGCE